MYGRTRQEVAEKLSKAVSDRVGGLVFDGDHETLEAYLQRWIDEVLRGTVKLSTFENYTYIARLHIIPELGRVRLRALKSRDVRRHYREKLDSGLSPQTAQIIHTVLRRALQQAVRDDVLPRNVCEERARAGSLWEETSLVFTSTIGTPVHVGNLTYRSFRPLLKRTNLPRIRFHDLRHTCTTLLLSKGTHPKIVQEMLGHANISMTMDTYSHVLPDMQEKAVSAMEDALS